MRRSHNCEETALSVTSVEDVADGFFVGPIVIVKLAPLNHQLFQLFLAKGSVDEANFHTFGGDKSIYHHGFRLSDSMAAVLNDYTRVSEAKGSA